MTRHDLTEKASEDLVELVLHAHGELERERATRTELAARLDEAEQQLRWFKQHLFGKKSERRVVEPDPAQLHLGESIAATTPPAAEATTTVRGHARRKRPEREGPDEGGLRFDETVPVRTVEIVDPEIEKLPEGSCTPVSEKVSFRLCQEPGAYVVLKIVRKVVKRADTGALSCPPAPPSVLEKSYADVSLLAGMLVDKFRHHLPLESLRILRRLVQLSPASVVGPSFFS